MDDLERLIALAKSGTKSDVEIVSIRLTGIELEAWSSLRKGHPNLRTSDLLKQALSLRAIADAAFQQEQGGLCLKHPQTGDLHEVLGYMRYDKPFRALGN